MLNNYKIVFNFKFYLQSRNQNAPCVKCEDDYFVGKSYQCVKAKDVVDKCISATYDFNNSNYNC